MQSFQHTAPCSALACSALACAARNAEQLFGDSMQGMLKGEELSAAYASADIFMMPSETEALGFVALEAMASGLPVVAVAAGGLTDIITQPGITSKHRKNGLHGW